MKRSRIPLLVATILVFIVPLACSFSVDLGSTPTTTSSTETATVPPSAEPPTPVPPTETPVPPTPGPELTQDMLMNFTYYAPQSGRTVTVVDGRFEDSSSTSYLQITILPQFGIGDVNGDGLKDAAVLLGENTGGTGRFVSLILLLNNNGTPVQTANYYIEDRAIANSLTIQDGQIVLDVIVHGPGDAMSGPTFHTVQTYAYNECGLVRVAFSAIYDNGTTRSVNITSPQMMSTVSGSVQVQGDMPIAPFEGTLAYQILDCSNNQLAMGSFMVNAADIGAPATIDTPIDLSGVPSGSLIQLQLVEYSMADGSVVSMGSVILNVQ